MASNGTIEDNATKLLKAQTHIWNHTFAFINSMSLKCAIELNIPDVIHNYGQPMPLSNLISLLPLVHPSKTTYIQRLMRILARAGFFIQQNHDDTEDEVSYALTDSSKLFLKDHPFSMAPFTTIVLDPIMLNPWHQLSSWFQNDDATPFKTGNGMPMWEYAGHDSKFNDFFNEVMARDSRLVSRVVVENCKWMFEGLESLVDVGGGTGTMAVAIAKAFPEMECISFDLPHVVGGLKATEKNLKFVGGNMFESIPPANAVLFKGVLHNWEDEDCIILLRKSKEAINNKGKEGKVMIIDMVMGNDDKGDKESIESSKLFYDMEMMTLVSGKERNQKEWAKLISSAGFSNYKITPILSARSLIEIYP